MRRPLIYILACAAIVAGRFISVAQTEQSLPPAVRDLVESERTFSRTSEAKGMREAFLTFLADDAIIFRPGPVNGKKVWQESPAPTGILSWRPIYTDVSAAGDLGYTTGPYEYRDHNARETPSGYGNFVTIWRRQADGKWKAILDIGTQNPPPAVTRTAVAVNAHQPLPATKQSVAQHTAELESRDQKFAELSARQGTSSAYLSFLSKRARLYRQQQFPLINPAAIQKFLRTKPSQRITWKPLKTVVAQSGDLGFTYGSYELREANRDLLEQGSYMRLWRRQSTYVWKVVLDIFNPLPPVKKE